jgi:hypothetical protein
MLVSRTITKQESWISLFRAIEEVLSRAPRNPRFTDAEFNRLAKQGATQLAQWRPTGRIRRRARDQVTQLVTHLKGAVQCLDDFDLENDALYALYDAGWPGL